ncbi:uncharacterized protein C2orf42 homolog [Caerostris darwini]|uniref:Uncharacterized protein C2orf42 homolog n=1 Tax=Caerostris darwini TaxID=1538125 RepID=A0AAV4SJC2_9ARAC|nr:uncharacterized protein C2orf42 homolog [Caerostris darwini]
MAEKNKNLFEDLGKPTLRGVRKCPKCGIFNGTRGLVCKNKECKLVFKLGKEKKKSESEVDAVKIISCSPLQIYSVKLSELNEDSRCFVHLPLIEGIEALQDEAEVTVIKRSAATCYAADCMKPTEDTGALHLNLNPCSHTHSVVNCITEAEPLILKRAVLKAMPISEIMKQQICALVSKPEEHLVQRITKNTMIVKCIQDDLHPLGYLHFSIFEPGKNARRFKILCGCQTQLTKPIVPREKQMCLHFYMCICAFASDSKLCEEFKPIVQSVLSSRITGNIQLNFEFPPFNCEINDPIFFDEVYPPPKRKKNTSINAEELFLQSNIIANNTIKQFKKGNNGEAKKKFLTLEAPSTTVSISFEQWLASVTERINQTMHYQFSGSPEPLVFQVPQVFFDVLHKRLSVGAKKKRLPNSVVGFCIKDSLPMGVFSKYTWEFTNILHVKRIFDTPEVPLEITRSFIENRDGTYVPYQPLKDEEEDLAQNYRKTLNNHLIKPLELKTFLKVGNIAPDQKEPTPFVVEWIPDMLPKTQVGELRIKFQFGHLRNDVLAHRNTIPSGTTSENTAIQGLESSGV